MHISDYAAAAARLLAEHPDLPVSAVTIRPSERCESVYPEAVEIQVVGRDEVTRWASACDTTVTFMKHESYVDMRARFVREGVAMGVWDNMRQDKAVYLMTKLGRDWEHATSVEVDPREILGEAVSA